MGCTNCTKTVDQVVEERLAAEAAAGVATPLTEDQIRRSLSDDPCRPGPWPKPAGCP